MNVDEARAEIGLPLLSRPVRTWWEKDAECADFVAPETFFEIENARDDDRVANPLLVAVALSFCARCTIRVRCGDVARATRSLGIWGGTTAAERALAARVQRKVAS